MRRALAWLLAVPIVAVGLLASHVAAYWITVPDSHERGQELAATGHGWLERTPLVLALCLALVVAAFAVIGASARGATTWPRLPSLFALLPPVAYLLHEYAELALQAGTVTPHVALDWTLVVGLALQIPFGFIALHLARALCRLSDTVGRALFAGPPPPVLATAVLARLLPVSSDLPRISVLALHCAGRAPPAVPS